MAKESTIQHYTSSTTGNTPSAVDLASGELAINIADEKVFLKNLLGNVVSLSQSKDLSGAFASKATVVTSFNGLTGAVSYSPAFASSSVTGVASFNSTYFTVGGNGAVTLASAYQVTGDTVAGGTGISVSKSGNTSTITNTGVQSFNGATGAVTGATLGANTFTALQTFSAGISASGATFSGPIQIPINTAPAIKIGNDATKNLTLASIDASGEIVQTGGSNSALNIRQESGGSVSIGDYNGTLNSNYIAVNDADSQIGINGVEIYLNGTIVTPLVLGSAESIQNTVNGRIDFMPGPTAAGAYGLYADLTGWGYGVQMGTINSAGTLDSSPNGILFMDAVTIVQDKFLNLGSDGSHALVLATQNGLDTLQIAVSPGAANSNAVAIAGRSDAGTVNRSPVTSHTNPNLYIYRAGNTGANDFIRIEHDGTNGNIVAGGTSGIKISGLLNVASGLSAAGATFTGNISAPNIVNSVNGLTGSVKIPRSLSVYAPTTSDSITLFYTPVALTISRISAVLRGSSTPSVTYNLNYGTDRSSGTLVFTSGTTVTSTTTATVVTSFNNSSIPAGGFLWLTASAVSGTVDELSVSVEF